MKYNPYINDWAAGLSGFSGSHPQALEENVQGSLEILFEIQEMFKAITGLPAVTTQPVAGAQGELVGIKMFQAYHRDRGEAESRNIVLIPRSAHGTNPATATMAGYETKKVGDTIYGIVLIEAGPDGMMNMDQLRELIKTHSHKIAGIMVTNPNTSGIFEVGFKEMASLIHQVGGLVYMDGANMNAIAGIVDLDKLGVDAVHNNLHKTWTIPHGGGGPGDAIVAVSHRLQDYLPGVQIEKQNGQFKTFTPAKSIGSFHRHYGNFAHKVRCYTYLKALGTEGVVKMSSVAVLCARYLQKKLEPSFPNLPAARKDNPIMHEFIITLRPELFQKIEQAGIPKANIIGRLGKLFLDFGLHAPTVSFPEPFGLMIEPTESFSKSELDHFVLVLGCILDLIETNPEILHTVPHFTPIARVDEVGANKNLQFFEKLGEIPVLTTDKISPKKLITLPLSEIKEMILNKHKERK
jgi:glycine dehydrogenase